MSEKASLLHEHAATVFEDFCRSRHPEAARYWEGNLEFNFVRLEKPGRVIVTEVKSRRLSDREPAQIKVSIKDRWQECTLSRKYPAVEFEVLNARALVSAGA